MYGMLVESVQHYVRKVYGEEKWLQILELSGFKNTVFATQRVYKDDVLPRIAENCSAVVMDKSTEDFLLFFGTCFVNFWSHYGYDRVVRVSGRHFRDFVHGIDNIHEMMRFSYPKMKSPSFYCEEESHEGLTLHYQSCRTGYSNYVCGQMSQVAKNFYNLDLNMVKLKDFQEGRGYHVVFRLYFDNSAFIPPKIKCIRSLSVEEQVPALRFLKLFPFCVVFQRNMKFVYVGEKVRELFGEDEFLTAEKVTDIFYIRRPPMDFTWENSALKSCGVRSGSVLDSEPRAADQIFTCGNSNGLDKTDQSEPWVNTGRNEVVFLSANWLEMDISEVNDLLADAPPPSVSRPNADVVPPEARRPLTRRKCAPRRRGDILRCRQLHLRISDDKRPTYHVVSTPDTGFTRLNTGLAKTDVQLHVQNVRCLINMPKMGKDVCCHAGRWIPDNYEERRQDKALI
ncbi:hypothetical protein Bbelb_114590 [Branchiostoma belcheri]|nr:hypothetical protein Bbelb_114590 [Branchiostoma belcheri]